MIDNQVPDFAWAGLLLTGVLLREARLLAATGVLSLTGACVTCYFKKVHF